MKSLFSTSVLLLIMLLGTQLAAQAIDFEDGNLPTGWSVVDQDGDGYAWRVVEDASHAHAGSHAVMCDNLMPNENEDWLITSQISVQSGDSLSFYTRSWVSSENLKVKLSTSGTSLNNFSQTLLSLSDITTTYQQHRIDLSSWGGQDVYLAFMWECDTYGIVIDDIFIGTTQTQQPQIELPDSFTFVQGRSLQVDFATYITNLPANQGQLTVANQGQVTVDIQGLMVDFSCGSWNGTQQMSFTISNGAADDTDTVDVVVEPAPNTELEAAAIINPQATIYLEYPIYPELTITNNGTATVDQSFDITCLITDPSDEAVYEQEQTCTQELAAGQSINYQFTTPWEADLQGTYNVTFTIDYEDSNQQNNEISQELEALPHYGQGGPDSFGYHWVDSTMEDGPEFSWIDISQTGNASIAAGVSGFYGDDNFVEPIDLGFDFPFYGNTYDSLYVDTNGEAMLIPGTWYDPYPSNGWNNDGNVFNWMYPIPGYTRMPALISVFWDDLEADENIGDIYWQAFGDAPERYVVVQWHNFRFHSGTDLQDYLDFELILHENGDIVMQYNQVATGQTGTQAPHDYGKSSTIAIQNHTGDMGLTYLQEVVEGSVWQGVEPPGNLPFSGLAIKFYSGQDAYPPTITHVQPGNTFSQQPVLDAVIVDQSAITQTVLHWWDGNQWVTTPASGTDGDTYHFTPGQLSTGSEFNYYFTATDTLGYQSTLPATAPDQTFAFNILPSGSNSLLLAYSGREDQDGSELAVYRTVLHELDVYFDEYDWQEYESYRIPVHYSSVIVFASTGSGSVSADTLSVSLMEFLDNGTNQQRKNVFFASDGFASSQSGTPNSDPRKELLTAYFRTTYVGPTIGGGTNGLAGPDAIGYSSGSIISVQGSPIAANGTEWDVYANSPDCLFNKDSCPSWYADQVVNPQIGSYNAFAFEDGPINGDAYLYHGVCGVCMDNLIYRTFYFSFDLSQLTSSQARIAMLQGTLDWFDELTGSDDIVNPVASVELGQNYPNPFNPNTKISFSVPQSGQVKLDVYNLKGRKVKSLVNNKVEAGNHTINWNGTDDNSRACASGVYFYRLQHKSEIITRRMLLLK